MKSIISKTKECFVCGTDYNIHEHHIFGGPNRKLSEKHGLKVCLCGYHHNLSNEGVHFNKELDTELKELGQRAFELNGSREEFIRIFGKNYL